ncbi:hypothetical protein [Candidatus Williamhamiltonella defendens]|uniref:hypothetical protein n=1 Tax=Candidatus Williamhamiltonella defendens TaxID=138072 RepID=UPI0020C5D095|nr:hypothetical protein [Candidatus Hamiltonella defensa]
MFFVHYSPFFDNVSLSPGFYQVAKLTPPQQKEIVSLVTSGQKTGADADCSGQVKLQPPDVNSRPKRSIVDTARYFQLTAQRDYRPFCFQPCDERTDLTGMALINTAACFRMSFSISSCFARSNWISRCSGVSAGLLGVTSLISALYWRIHLGSWQGASYSAKGTSAADR